ncbi:TrbC/VirB2 family protein [Succinivibrio dextrinosolvens]|uniref:Type IV secretory pathway, VirB2 components (Pilins) n=1 Tax=Succinivibrio dextrinosolvens DSM 3072 TaxID=1123324 RepID=A0A1T4VDP4_9GAMM|nr:TrbC/VirB2 family protein [Succinivibrio dextrinosolvens]SKA62998.1 Type IV secretory pathway, VirB2 components (pilins) [Succinivibrio dextrinosolvens DSM 3072]
MNRFIVTLVTLVSLCAVVGSAFAADTSSSAVLPYENWLKTIQKSLTGPVAFSISIIGIISCGVTLIFSGGEINRFMKSVIYLVFVMTLLVGANSFMSSVFNGATIAFRESDERVVEKVYSDYSRRCRVSHVSSVLYKQNVCSQNGDENSAIA